MSENILNIDGTPPPKEDWEAAEIIIRYEYHAQPSEKSIHITREEVVEEKREEYLRRPGVTEEAMRGFDITVEQFQGLVYAAARQLVMSPLFIEEENKFLSPMAIDEVEVRPVRKSHILTPDSSVVVPN